MHCAEGQPFPLKLIHEVLRLANDADYEFLLQAEIGLPVGVLNKLPRTPAVFEEQTSWRLEDDPLAFSINWAANYSSAEEHMEHIREHFAEEVTEGLMEELNKDEAEARFGRHLSVAALAVLVDEISGKKRIIHDGSNQVRVNHKIKSLDKLRMPGPKEKFHILKGLEDRRDVAIAILGDVSKAHRRFKHCKEEQGYLACRVSDADQSIFINKVGTFGIGSAAYWWGRIFAAVGRATFYLLGPYWPVELLAFADDLEAIGVGANGREAVVMSYLIMTALGTPFKWSKLRGGIQVDWIGLHTDYAIYKLGLSEGRAAWLARWCAEVADQGCIDPRLMASGLGRLCFAAGTLFWERPFLGPLYAWMASIRDVKHKVMVPWAIAFIMRWLAEKLSTGMRLQSPPRIGTACKELFRSDAKATPEGAWIGGWETAFGNDTKRCRWFAMKVEESWAPWVFAKKKDPRRVIAALELLGNVVAIMLFGNEWPRDSRGRCCGSGGTDNQGNSFVVNKLMSTKYPLTMILMELSQQLRHHNLELHLDWIPRDQNEPADDLTNWNFEKFDETKRIQVEGPSLKFLILGQLAEMSRDLYVQIQKFRDRPSKSSKHTPEQAPRSKKRKLEPW